MFYICMIYKKIDFNISYKNFLFPLHKTQEATKFKYKNVKNIFTTKNYLHLLPYKSKEKIEHHKLKKKTFKKCLHYQSMTLTFYKTKAQNIQPKKINYLEQIIKKYKCNIEKKHVINKFKYYEFQFYAYKIPSIQNLNFDLFELSRKNDNQVKKSIMINMFYCAEKSEQIFELKQYHNVLVYEKEDDIFFKVDGKIFGKRKSMNVIYLKKIGNELTLEFFNNM